MSPNAEEQHTAVADAVEAKRLPASAIESLRSVLRRRPWLEWLIPAALCAVLLGQLFLSVRQLSETSDESTHIYAGYRFLKCGDLDFSREHPPLARVVAAAPLLSMGLKLDCSPVNTIPQFSWRNMYETADSNARAMTAHGWLYSQDDWRTVLFRARIAASAFTVGLLLLVWTAARRMFGLTTAIIATILLVFEPTVLATGALVMTDMPSACTLFFAVFAFYLWARNRTVPFLLLAGLATGLALIAKHSGVLVIPILCVLALADAYIWNEDERPRLRIAFQNLLAVGLVCVLAIAVVWYGHGFRSHSQSGRQEAQEMQPPTASENTGILLAMEKAHLDKFWLLPQAYLQGFAEAAALTKHAAPIFTLGNIYQRTPWFFIPLNLAIRYTAALLLMIPLAAFGWRSCFRQHRRELLFLLVPLGIYLAVCLSASRIGGIRHTLPMLPFLLIIVAVGCVELVKTMRWVAYVLPCLLVLHAASSLYAYPNYLSYANEFWGGPTKTYKYLPAQDWGQAYDQANDYLKQHPGPCWLFSDWQWDPKLYGLPCETVGPRGLGAVVPPRLRGTVILSSTLLTTTQTEAGQIVAPFARVRPKDTIGGSALLVYEGEFDTSAAASRSALQAAFASQTFDAALQYIDDAVALAPKSPAAHLGRCWVLARGGRLYAAVAECDTAIRLCDPSQRAEAQQFEQNLRATYNLPTP